MDCPSLVSAWKNMFSQKEEIGRLKKENKKIVDREQKVQGAVDRAGKSHEALQLKLVKSQEEVKRLKSENKVLSGSYLMDWKPFILSQEKQGLGFTEIQFEASTLEECGINKAIFKTIKELGNPVSLLPAFKEFCYIVSMKGRIQGKGKEYSEGLEKLVQLCQAYFDITKGKV